MLGRRFDSTAAQPRAAARRGSLPVSSLQSTSSMATWKIPTSNQPPHAQDDSAMGMGSGRAARHTHTHAPPRPRPAAPPSLPHAPVRAHADVKGTYHDCSGLDHSLGPTSKYPHGVHKIVPPTTGFDLQGRSPGRHRTPSQAPASQATSNSTTTANQEDVKLPDGTLHVWVYQARHLVFRRLFETMYERHGLRLRVYAGSCATNDVGEIYETRRNYGGNMANPRWRRDQDDARDDAHGHFRIPLARESLRIETELTVEIVCGILVVAHTKISVPALFLGSFGTTLATLAAHNMQFRPHWFPLAGEDAGLLEMALEFIPTRIVHEQHVQQRRTVPSVKNQSQANHAQPESDSDDEEDDDEDEEQDSVGYDHYDQEGYDQHYQHLPPPPYQPPLQHQRRNSRTADHQYEHEKESDRQRAREYEALGRREQLRHQRFEMLGDDPHETRPQERARSATTASSSSSSSTQSTRFVLPRRQSLSVLDADHDHHLHRFRQSSQYDYEGQYYGDEGLVIMDAYEDDDESSPPPSEFSGYELHDSGFDATTKIDAVPYEEGDSYRSSMESGSDYEDGVSLSASSSWVSASTLGGDPSQENLQNKQLWDLYRYGISDESPEEIDTSRGGATSTIDSVSIRDSSLSITSLSASMVSRKMSTMSQASNFSVAFSDVSEASMLSREASTCASEILTYNDRIQRMEEAIRLARERRDADANAAPPDPPRPPLIHQQAKPERWTRVLVPPPISTRPPATLTAFGWERPSPPLSSPSTSEPVVVESRKGVVLFDMDHIPVKRQSGQTDPALEAYRAKMLARRRSLPIHMLSGGMAGGLEVGGGRGMIGRGGSGGIRPSLVRESSAPSGRLSIAGAEPSWPVTQGRAVHTKYDSPTHDPPNRWHNNQTREDRPPVRPVAIVDSPLSRVPSWTSRHQIKNLKQTPKAHEEPVRSPSRTDNNTTERNSTSSIDGLPGPPGLRRKRSSSLHSISDLLCDQSFRIHNLAVSPAPSRSGSASGSTSGSHAARASRRPSVSDHSNGNGRSSVGSAGERKLSKASSYASSDASSTSQSIAPANPTTITSSASGNTSTSASGWAPRVRRNSKGGGNVVQINGIVLGIGKFINVGNVPGVIRYIGPTMFAPGQWIGIELVDKKGKHNGTVQNVQYFECAAEHGIFIRAERLDIST